MSAFLLPVRTFLPSRTRLQFKSRTATSAAKRPSKCSLSSSAERAAALVRRGTLHPSDVPFFTGLTPERAARLQRVVEARTNHVLFCFDNVHGVHNLAAVVRSCDAWGIQELHVIANLESHRAQERKNRGTKFATHADSAVRGNPEGVEFDPDETNHRARFRQNGQSLTHLFEQENVKKVSKSAHKWLTIAEHTSARLAVQTLRDRGYRICASSLHPNAKKLSEVDLSEKVAFVFGNEHSGVSEEMFNAADEFFTIPMYGFVESTNVSVAAATVASNVVERIRASTDSASMEKYFLSATEQAELYGHFLKPQVKRKSPSRLTSRFDVTRLGSVVERRVAKWGMFVAKDFASSGSDVSQIFRLSTNGGVLMNRFFTRRVKIGALGDTGGTTGWSKRCRSLDEGLSGLSALSCEGCLANTTSTWSGVRHYLLPFFQHLVLKINNEYSQVFDEGGLPSIPMHLEESAERLHSIRQTVWRHIWDASHEVCNSHPVLSSVCIKDVLERTSISDVARCIAKTIHGGQEANGILLKASAMHEKLFPAIESTVRNRDSLRDMFVDAQWFENRKASVPLSEDELSALQIVIRLAHTGDLASCLHWAAWEKELGFGAKRVMGIRFSLLEVVLMESHSEMTLLGFGQDHKHARCIYEWACVVSQLKRLVQTIESVEPQRATAIFVDRP